MKNTFKYLLLLGAAALGLAACQQKEEADIKGVVGDFAYIVDGTEAKYAGTTCEVFHTPIGEMGELATTVTVALTKVQKSDVEVVLALDNAAIDDDCTAFPAGVLKFNENVTIPAGQKEVAVNVTVANADFAKLVDLKYQAIFRIASASVVKVSSNSNAAYLTALTETINPADNVVTVKGSTSTFELKHYHGEDGSVETLSVDMNKTITISGTEEAFLPFDVTLVHDPALIAAYNAANGTSYMQVPSNVTVSISAATMAKDATSTTAVVSISKEDQAKLLDSNGYLIPVKVTNVGDATLSPDCGISYIAVNVKNIQGSSNFFSALYLGDYNMATWYMFQKPVSMSNGYTYIFHMFIDEFDADNKMRIGDFADANEKWINMLRIGEKSGERSLEWFVGPDGCRVKLYTPVLEAQKWYHVALRFDNNKYQLYLEKQIVAEYKLSDEEKEKMKSCAGYPATFQALEFNSSWGADYRNGSAFQGRLWYVSVWNQALRDSYIKNYTYRTIHSAFLTNAGYGLQHFWPMDDAAGHILVEKTGRGENIDFSKTTRCDDESSMTSADVSAYVGWKNDSFNDFSGN